MGSLTEGRSFAPLFSSASVHWPTPIHVFEALNAEFAFDLDPCPLHSLIDGLARPWGGHRVYCNPPYGPGLKDWLAKAAEAKLAVFLLPARTDTRWFHDYCMKAGEIRFLRGRLKFGDAKANAPFPSMVVIFRNVEVAP